VSCSIQWFKHASGAWKASDPDGRWHAFVSTIGSKSMWTADSLSYLGNVKEGIGCGEEPSAKVAMARVATCITEWVEANEDEGAP
jgi:hypothetical protein